MGYVKDVQIGSNTHLIEPTIYAATAGTAAAITAAISNFELVTGVIVTIKITTSNNANATLSVNGTTAKSIYYNNAAINANVLQANRVYSLVYDGTYWQVIGELNTYTTLHTLATTTKYYVTGSTSSTTNTAGDSFDTGVYVTTTAGELSAVRHTLNVSGTDKAYMTYNNTDNSIDFIFNQEGVIWHLKYGSLLMGI